MNKYARDDQIVMLNKCALDEQIHMAILNMPWICLDPHWYIYRYTGAERGRAKVMPITNEQQAALFERPLRA